MKFSTSAVVLVLMIMVSWFVVRDNRSKAVFFDISQLTKPGTIVASPPRVEREFKISILADGPGLYFDEGLEALKNGIYQALTASLSSGVWQATALAGKPYFMKKDPNVLVFRDIYYDTDDKINCQKSLAYRLRHRFKSTKQLHQHEIMPTGQNNFPHRGEIQAKVDRVDEPSGFSHVKESRLEFRVESEPFSEARPPPPAPWHPKDFTETVKSGLYLGEVTSPGNLLAKVYKRLGRPNKQDIKPSLVLVASRIRMHLNMKTEYGSGPNPDQAFIITIDRTDQFDGTEYVNYLNRAWYEGAEAVRPFVINSFSEIEIEFERNISTLLDKNIQDNVENVRAVKLREAFLADQKMIKKIIVYHLNSRGLEARGLPKSKYRQACEAAKYI